MFIQVLSLVNAHFNIHGKSYAILHGAIITIGWNELKLKFVFHREMSQFNRKYPNAISIIITTDAP